MYTKTHFERDAFFLDVNNSCKFEEINMNKHKYLYKSEEFLKVYQFVSKGPNGDIKKMV